LLEINETFLKVGWTVGRIHFPKPSATFIVKGTFKLKLGQPAVPAKVQLELEDDVFVEDDRASSLRYSSDFADFKPCTDLFVVGSCYAPGNRAVTSLPVSVTVGSFTKQLNVIGDRIRRRPFADTFSPPQPFTRMALIYENSYGGTGFPQNPVGKGFQLSDEGTADVVSLPNIEPLGAARIGGELQPAGFGPLPLGWPQRMAKAGTYGEQWLKERWPWLPDDFDWTFFNAAPEDQQLKSYLKGNEHLKFENLHPLYSDFQSQLPSIRVRCFHADVIGAPISFREVAMVLDTLWAEPETETLVLVWRGFVELRADDLGEEDQLLVVSERIGESIQTVAYYEELCQKRASEFDEQSFEQTESIGVFVEIPAPEIVDEEKEQFEKAAREDIEETEEVELVSREWCVARYQEGKGFKDLDLTGVDLSDLSLPGAGFIGAVLTDAFLRNTNLEDADFSGAVLAGCDLSGARLHRATLKNTDLTSARLVAVDLRESNLDGADFSGAVLRRANIEACSAKGSTFVKADLFGAVMRRGQFVEANLSRAILHQTDFSEAVLSNASIEGALGFPVKARGANLSGLRASNALLWEADFYGVIAPGSIWQEAELRAANFSTGDLTKAEFEAAILTEVDFSFAVLRNARLVKANLRGANLLNADLFKASVEKADLSGANLARANLYGAEIVETLLQNANLEGANLKRTLLTILP
jgi:uncharacterized protein YjbI with pentapeptide repeats